MALYIFGSQLLQKYNAYLNSTRLLKIYYNNVLVWTHKNTDIITWDDALHGDHQYTVTGDPLSSNCSCHDSSHAYGYGPESAAAGCRGRINPGTRILFCSASAVADVSSRSGKIYNCDGIVIANLNQGNNDVTAYNDGTYYFTYGASGTSWADEPDAHVSVWADCSCSMSS